ncbi:myelin-oligodendrocyte glycoprotein-like isoform X3 [Thunnus albacares]|uniref:myelin-oligodendrocyte glycoprotein-like isoform X3 n=1 Tax=Thunnus albacares TaxID=8236 RepID=UPI001CF68DB5|nr:myelin-oligodendrocyte glycoprotein-like isoform X3 [Thunnus albacares]
MSYFHRVTHRKTSTCMCVTSRAFHNRLDRSVRADVMLTPTFLHAVQKQSNNRVSHSSAALRTFHLCLSVIYMFKMDFEQFSNMFTFWIFILCLTFIVWIPVEGQFKVIGSTQPIIASPGDDVILPCHLDPEFNVQGLTVEWSKPDLKPDPSDRLSRAAYVHLYRHRQEDLDMKIPAYLSRTELFTDELERGNISLKIMNMTLADEGRYRCFIPKLKSRVQSAIVRLVVVEVKV